MSAGMTTAHLQCPRCGKTLSARATEGLCAACLLAAALSPDDERDPADLFPYCIVTLLAGDSDGVTYLARTTSGAPRYVALKVLRRCSDPDAVVSRFERWKPALAALTHPSLAPVVDVGRVGDRSIYLVADYVPGSPLQPLLKSPGLDAEQRAEIVRQIAAALRAAHDRGVAHMRLDASRMKITAAAAVRAHLLGLGTALIVDGTAPDPEFDRRALVRIAAELGVPVPQPGPP
jgi:hypothetical protein